MYADYIKNGGTGIIELLSKNQTLKFILSDVIDPLDSAFLMENGSKQFSLSISNMLNITNDLTPIANMLKIRFGQYWKVLYNSQPTDEDTVYSSITTSNGELNTTGNNINQVSGYDSPNMVNSDGSNSTGNQTNNYRLRHLPNSATWRISRLKRLTVLLTSREKTSDNPYLQAILASSKYPERNRSDQRMTDCLVLSVQVCNCALESTMCFDTFVRNLGAVCSA